MDEELVEKVAKAIYLWESGMSPEEWKAATGKKKKAWKTDAPWDTNPDELCEWERDEYRTQAREVIKLVNRDGLRSTVKEVIGHLEGSVVGGRMWNEGQEEHAHFVLPLAAKLRVALGETTVKDPGAGKPLHDTFPLNGLVCSVCGEPQYDTPHGEVCENGHGGAPGVDPTGPCRSCGGSGLGDYPYPCDDCGGKGTTA